MTNITFPLSEANVAQCMAERDAEIERLRADKLHWEHQNGILEAEIERLHSVVHEHEGAWRREIERLRREYQEMSGKLVDVGEDLRQQIMENERLQEYKRKQMVDIMDLGQQVGKLEIENERLRAELTAERERCARIADEYDGGAAACIAEEIRSSS